MKKIIAFVAVAGLAFACGNAASDDNNANDDTVAQAASNEVDGEKIYRQYCVTCHGVNGDMGASGAHDLTVSELTLEERIDVITNGQNAMYSYATRVSPEERWAVVAYIRVLQASQNATLADLPADLQAEFE